MAETSDTLRFPVGDFVHDPESTPDKRAAWIDEISATPARLRGAIKGLQDEQFDVPYRPGGWTIRQVIHHMADSHINSFIRFKLALTENSPTIKTYDEAAWAELPDSRATPVELSLTLLDALHERWALLLRSLCDDDYQLTLNHPERGHITLDALLQLYAWHGRHHIAHITSLREREGW